MKSESFLNNSWIQTQARQHLVIGYMLEQPKKFKMIVLVPTVLVVIYRVINAKSVLIGLIDTLPFAFLVYFLKPLRNVEVAAYLWVVTKAVCAVIGGLFVMLIPVLLSNNDTATIPIALSGFFLIPGPEFVPKLQSYQKLITGTTIVVQLILWTYVSAIR